ncbi:MAG: sulfide-dependent adenosine diphosphate thiazole synthase [Candidatus Brocadiia bacterium]
MKLDEIRVTRLIVESYARKLSEAADVDVAIAGGGPAGITAAAYLAHAGHRVALFERKLSLGGGMWGGGMMFNEIVVQDEGKEILDDMGVASHDAGDGYWRADAVHAVAALLYKATCAGARFLNCIGVEDVMLQEGRVTGLVIQYSPIEMAGLHVDPLTIRARAVVEATGHPAEVARVLVEKARVRLDTPSGGLEGERPMDAQRGETAIVENTRQVFPGLYVAGMAANAVYGAPRMGPIFGGMLLSGRKVAQLIDHDLATEKP